MSTTFWLEYAKGRKLLEDPGTSGSGQGPVVDRFEHENKALGSIKVRENLE